MKGWINVSVPNAEQNYAKGATRSINLLGSKFKRQGSVSSLEQMSLGHEFIYIINVDIN